MDKTEIIENLRTTLLWENVCHYIERVDQASLILEKTSLVDTLTVEIATIQDSEDFYIKTIKEDDRMIVVTFEMPFIICVNEKYNIQAVAIGNLNIPNTEDYLYEKHDFISMDKKKLLSFENIVSISKIHYESVEIISMW